VYLISFPRSGNTWLRYLLTALVCGPAVDAALVDRTVPDIHHSDPASRPTKKAMWVKSHMPAREGPPEAKVIYLVRHGLQAMLSYHRYLQARGRLPANSEVKAFLMAEDVWPCRWADHVEGWLTEVERRPADRALLVHYEDLEESTALHLGRIASFLELDVGPGQLEEAVAAAGRERMMMEERRSGAGTLNLVGAAEPSPADDLGSGWIEANSRALDHAGYHG
jgi:hypothetical protein